MPRPSSRRPLLGALVLSVLLHGAMGGWWLTREPLARPVTSRAPTPIEIVLVPPESKQQAALETSEAEPPQRPEQKQKPGKKPEPEALAQRPPPPPPEAPAEIPRVGEGADSSSPLERPAHGAPEPEPLALTDAPLAGTGAPLTLRPNLHTPFSSLGTGEGSAGGGIDAGVLRIPTSADSDFVEHLVQDDLARAKVKRGVAHSYYGELGKALLSAWDAEKAVDAAGLEGWLAQAGERIQNVARAYADKARGYAQTGQLYDAPTGKRTNAPTSAGADGALASLDLRRQIKEDIRKDLRESRRAEVKVIQDGSGRLLAVELVKPSRDPKIDQQALSDVRSAAAKLPPPPPEATGADDRLVSVWSFEVIISITPPVPMVAISFDEALGFFDARLPLDRRIYKRVQLLAFY